MPQQLWGFSQGWWLGATYIFMVCFWPWRVLILGHRPQYLLGEGLQISGCPFIFSMSQDESNSVYIQSYIYRQMVLLNQNYVQHRLQRIKTSIKKTMRCWPHSSWRVLRPHWLHVSKRHDWPQLPKERRSPWVIRVSNWSAGWRKKTDHPLKIPKLRPRVTT